MQSTSIHPGVKDGKRRFPLSHTNKPSKRKNGLLAKLRRRLNLRQIAHAMTIKTPHVKVEAFRAPGSMNPHKR